MIYDNCEMIQVTMDEFYKSDFINKLDVIIHITGDYPYNSEFRTRYGGQLKGVVIGGYCKYDNDDKYYMLKSEYKPIIEKPGTQLSLI